MLVGHPEDEPDEPMVLKTELLPMLVPDCMPLLCPWLPEERLEGFGAHPTEPMLEGAGELVPPQGLESMLDSLTFDALHGLEAAA